MLEEPKGPLLFRCSGFEKWVQALVKRSDISWASSLSEGSRIQIPIAFTPGLCAPLTKRLRLIALDFTDSDPMGTKLAVCTNTGGMSGNIVVLAGYTPGSDFLGAFAPRGHGPGDRT